MFRPVVLVFGRNSCRILSQWSHSAGCMYSLYAKQELAQFLALN